MAIQPKKAVLQIRLDSGHLERFQKVLAGRGETASSALRRIILRIIEDADASAHRQALKLAELSALQSSDQARRVALSVQPVSRGLDDDDDDDDDDDVGQVPMSRQQRRKAERDAKKGR